MENNKFIVVFVTCKSEDEGRKIAKSIVEQKLAACVNIIANINSVYIWEGKVCDDIEALLIIKTINEKFDDLQTTIKSLHSYSVPEIIAIPIVEGSQEYLKWVDDMTR